jgi:hypothetical protein
VMRSAQDDERIGVMIASLGAKLDVMLGAPIASRPRRPPARPLDHPCLAGSRNHPARRRTNRESSRPA